MDNQFQMFQWVELKVRMTITETRAMLEQEQVEQDLVNTTCLQRQCKQFKLW